MKGLCCTLSSSSVARRLRWLLFSALFFICVFIQLLESAGIYGGHLPPMPPSWGNPHTPVILACLRHAVVECGGRAACEVSLMVEVGLRVVVGGRWMDGQREEAGEGIREFYEVDVHRRGTDRIGRGITPIVIAGLRYSEGPAYDGGQNKARKTFFRPNWVSNFFRSRLYLKV